MFSISGQTQHTRRLELAGFGGTGGDRGGARGQRDEVCSQLKSCFSVLLGRCVLPAGKVVIPRPTRRVPQLCSQ